MNAKLRIGGIVLSSFALLAICEALTPHSAQAATPMEFVRVSAMMTKYGASNVVQGNGGVLAMVAGPKPILGTEVGTPFAIWYAAVSPKHRVYVSRAIFDPDTGDSLVFLAVDSPQPGYLEIVPS